MMERVYSDYLSDILINVKRIEAFTKAMSFEKFSSDEKTTYAVIRALEIIGEAVKNLPASLKSKYPEVPWKQMAGMRDRLTHAYFGVKIDVVWHTITVEIPNLRSILTKIIKEQTGQGRSRL
jgi:uncharacterized protein with HEPN domain